MKAVFVANLELEENEGIYKKVCSQSDAIGKTVGECLLITRHGKKAKIRMNDSSSAIVRDERFLDYIENLFRKREVEMAYIRHMIPGIHLIRILRLAQKNGIKVYYEIPTYPYFAEQFRTSKRKYRAVVKIVLDLLFWPWIYRYINKLVVIKSNTKVKMYSKMVEITNGVRTDTIKSKNYKKENSSGIFRMVAVGTLYPYHGYDRVLRGLKACGEKVGDTVVEFHIVGNSPTIEELKGEAQQMKLNHVFFHGVKSTEELNVMYEDFHVGLGCLALHRRNADIDTTLKIIEYYCRGVPVVTSGYSPMDAYHPEFTIHLSDGEQPVDIPAIYDEYQKIEKGTRGKISRTAQEIFSWDYIMCNLFEDQIERICFL